MLGHFLSRPNHYDVFTDTYLIHGVRFHGDVFRCFAAPNEEVLYRFKRKGELVTIEHVLRNTTDLPSGAQAATKTLHPSTND